MAKYVEYTPEVFAVQDGSSVQVWWFPPTFSQSQLGDRVIGSNACTLIAVLITGRLHEFQIPIWGYFDQPLSRMLVTSIAEAIIEGNEIHEALYMAGQLVDVDLTVPEAINAVNFKYPNLTEWTDKTTFVNEPILDGEGLATRLRSCITDFEYNPPRDRKESSDLYMILVTGGKSVLFCYQRQMSKITFIDSHTHPQFQSGAVVAQARVSDVVGLCQWYAVMSSNIMGNMEMGPYEIACIYWRE